MEAPAGGRGRGRGGPAAAAPRSDGLNGEGRNERDYSGPVPPGAHSGAGAVTAGAAADRDAGRAAAAPGGSGQRIAFLVISLAQGGAETQLVRLARGLNARGWDVTVISMLPPTGLADELVRGGVRLETLGVKDLSTGARGALRLYRLLRAIRPRVLCTFMYHADITGRLVGRLAGVPVVVSSVRADRFGPALRDRIMGVTDRLADVTTTNSRYVADDLLQRRVVRSGRIRVIPNGLELSGSAVPASTVQALRGELGVGTDTFAWLAVGHLAVRKDYPTLLRALHLLRARPAPWKLFIVGSGTLEEPLRALAAELGLAERVRFMGFRKDAAQLVHAADGLVMSSSMEGTPNALMEAMLAGKPTVGTRVGGIPELLEDGVNGYLVPPADPAALAGAMARLMDTDEGERARMGERGRARVMARHDLGAVVEQWDELFRELIAARGGAAEPDRG